MKFDPGKMSTLEYAWHLAENLDANQFPELWRAAADCVDASLNFEEILKEHNDPLQTFDIDTLLLGLKENPDSVLSMIDADQLLNKAEHPSGLVIANASKSLFTPVEEHHLYAKGIVYRRNPYELVSLPLLKIYNYGEKGRVDHITDQLAADTSLRITLPVKEDGYMAQLFEHNGEVYATTRSMLEGSDTHTTHKESGGFDYVKGIRDIAKDKYPALLDPDVLRGKSIVCEAVHPEMENGVTKYGDGFTDLIVISVFDLEAFEYWSNDRVIQWATKHSLEPVDYLTSDVTLREAFKVVHAIDDDSVPEGGVVCFEKDGRVVHRVKVKTERWCREAALMYNCTLRNVSIAVWEEPDFEDFEAFTTHLQENGLTSEETLEHYKEHHDTYLQWLEGCKEKAEGIRTALQEALNTVGDAENEAKALAAYLRGVYSKKDFGLIMNCYRNADVLLYDVMWQDELFRGIKGYIHEERQKHR